MRWFRAELGLKQTDLAQRAGVSLGTITGMENYDRPYTLQTLIPVARILEVSVACLEATGRPSILVLPLQNHSDESLSFVSAVVSALITAIGSVDQLAVKSHYTSMRQQDKALALPEIVRVLGVDYLLEGSITSSGTGVITIALHLVDALRDELLFTLPVYQADRGDIIARLQAAVATDVAVGLGLALSAADHRRIARLQSVDSDVYLTYFMGRHHWMRPTEQGLLKAIDYFNAAIEKAPNWALPYAGMADSYNLLALGGFMPPLEALNTAEKYARKALAITADLPEALTPLAAVASYRDWDWKKAEKTLQTAIQLDPKYDTAHHVYAMTCLVPLGRTDEAIEQMKLAELDDPYSPFIATCVGIAHYYARKCEEAIPYFQRSLELQSDFHLALWYLGCARQAQGQLDAAAGALERAVQQTHRSSQVLAALGNCYGVMGKRQDAEAILTELKERSTREFISPHTLGVVVMGVGQPDRAMDLFEQAASQRTPAMILAKTNPQFDQLRTEQRFWRLVEKMGL